MLVHMPSKHHSVFTLDKKMHINSIFLKYHCTSKSVFLVIFNAHFVKNHISKTKIIMHKIHIFCVSALLFITGRLYNSLLPVF